MGPKAQNLSGTKKLNGRSDAWREGTLSLEMTMTDIESSIPFLEDDGKKTVSSPTTGQWRKFLCATFLAFAGVGFLFCARASASESFALGATVEKKWHPPKPFKPVHKGKVVFLTEKDSATGTITYKRIFTVPCANGILVFNVGPAAEYEPFDYDIYDDAYAYSDQKGLCPLFPTYTATQESDEIMWEPSDPTEVTVDRLGDEPFKISTRVVTQPGTKKLHDPSKRGGDFVVMRKGNFYDAGYYQGLKKYINSWKASEPPTKEDIDAMLQQIGKEI
jgi:hypothetical protein